MNRFFIHTIVFGLTSCIGITGVWLLTNPIKSNTETNQNNTAAMPFVELQEAFVPTSMPAENIDEVVEDTRIEYFSDEKKVGRRGKNRIEIRCFSRGADRFADIKFYTLSEYGAWFEMQSFRFDKDGVTDCNPVIEDYNNDGYNDFTYESNVATRGANVVRRLFIYDRKVDELLYIENSEQYPNLAYNKKLKCIDAFLVYGASSTVFLRIEGNELKEFASVETGNERVVTVTNKLGEKKILRREKMDPDNFEELFTRFSTFNPPS